MKNALAFTLATLMLAGVAFAAVNPTSAPTAATLSPAPLPTSTCSQERTCNSEQAVLSPGEGSPMPLCPPGQNCDGQLRQMAGEGSPMPLCPPGQNCDGQLRQIAGEGSPMPLCPPGHNCDGQWQPPAPQVLVAAAREQES